MSHSGGEGNSDAIEMRKLFGARTMICTARRVAFSLDRFSADETDPIQNLKIRFDCKFRTTPTHRHLILNPCELYFYYEPAARVLAPDDLGDPILGQMVHVPGGGAIEEPTVQIAIFSDFPYLREIYRLARLFASGQAPHVEVRVYLNDLSDKWVPDPSESERFNVRQVTVWAGQLREEPTDQT